MSDRRTPNLDRRPTTIDAPRLLMSGERPGGRGRAVVAALVLAGSMGLAAGLGGCGPTRPRPALNTTTPAAAAAEATRLVERAVQAEKAGKRREAIDLYRQAVETYREYPVAWNNLGVLLLDEAEVMDAAAAFRVAADVDLRDPRPVFNLGVIWERSLYFDDAQRFYGQALERDQNYLPALRRSIYLDERLGRMDESTTERLRRALLIETDAKWREFFERQKIRIDARTPENESFPSPSGFPPARSATPTPSGNPSAPPPVQTPDAPPPPAPPTPVRPD